MKSRRRATFGEWKDAAEAFALLCGAKPICAFATLDTIERLLPNVASRRVEGAEPAVVEAVERAARRIPFSVKCFPRALASAIMLRRRGLVATLEYGLALDSRGLAGHVWTSVDGAVVVGGNVDRSFTEVRVLGAPPKTKKTVLERMR